MKSLKDALTRLSLMSPKLKILSDNLFFATKSRTQLAKEVQELFKKLPSPQTLFGFLDQGDSNSQPPSPAPVPIPESQERKARLINNKNSDPPPNSDPKKAQDAGSGSISGVTKIFDDLKGRLTAKPKTHVPQWKTRRHSISLESINSRTTHVLISVMTATSDTSRFRRLEEFASHLSKFPQAKPHAVKEGAVKILSNLRKNTKDEASLQMIRQIFAMLGHVDPPRAPGVRVLTIDGGGMRGIAVIRMLQYLEQLSGKRIYELFDYVCGVSTGAVISCCMVPPLEMSLEALYKLYGEMSSKVFTQSAIWGTGKLVWRHAYYETSLWEEMLKNNIGNATLLETSKYPNAPKVCTVATVVNKSRVIPFLFRNYSVPYLRKSEYQGSSRHTIFEAIRASAAAPTIFEEYRIGDLLLQDGGILVNNPTALALHEVKALWPDEQISCVVSCGTGRHNPVATQDSVAQAQPISSSWKSIFDKILDSATDTEAVHTMLNDLLPEDIYFRLNPHLAEPFAMDETRHDKIIELEEETQMYCRRNETKFQHIAKKLTTPRSIVQKCHDYYREQLKLFGPITT